MVSKQRTYNMVLVFSNYCFMVVILALLSLFVVKTTSQKTITDTATTILKARPSSSSSSGNNDGEFLYFWQLTDPHLDMEYQVGSVGNCDDLPICCRQNSKRSASSTVSSATFYAGKFGHPEGNCDIPLITFQNAIQFTRNYFPEDFKKRNELFVAYTGDNQAHDDWNYTKQRNLDAMYIVHKTLFSILRSFNSSSLVLSAIGNHDGYPVDQFDTPPGSAWFLDPFTNVMKQSGIEELDAFETMKRAGYYTVQLRPGLRALVLNTQYQDDINFYLYKSKDQDPAQQLAFIRQVLSSAKENREKVIIIGHIPPGMKDRSPSPSCLVSYSRQFQQILTDYGETVIMQTYGHTHTDSFRVIMDSNTNTVPKSVAFITPSVTTWTHQNPAVRLFKFNKEYPYDLIDMVTFISNITRANMEGEMKFEVEYSARDAYSMPDLSPKSWLSVANQLLTNNTVWSQFQAYYNTLLRGDRCQEKKCRLAQYCSTVNTDIQHYAKCILN